MVKRIMRLDECSGRLRGMNCVKRALHEREMTTVSKSMYVCDNEWSDYSECMKMMHSC